MGLFGYAIPEEYGGLGLDDHPGRGAGVGAGLHDVGVPLAVRHEQRDRRAGPRRLRHRRAEEAVAGADGRGPRGGLVRADRARGRVGPVGHAQHRDPAPATAGSSTGRSGSSPTPPSPTCSWRSPRSTRRGDGRWRCSSCPRTRPGSRVGPKDQQDGPGGRDHRRRHLRRRAGRRRRPGQRRGAHRLPGRHDRARPGSRAHLGVGDGAGPAGVGRVGGLRGGRSARAGC